MSLLMDALKKAEQEKREAARRLEEAREKAHAGAIEALPDPEITAEMPMAPEPDVPPAPPVELSLEPRASVTGPMELMARSASPAEPAPRTEPTGPEAQPVLDPELLAPAASRAPKTPLEFVEEIGPEGMASFDQTFHGVALNEGAVPGMFDETLPGSSAEPPPEPQRSYDQTLPGVPAAQLARDIGTADQPTPAAAQTVFAAGQARRPDRLYRWGLGGLGVLVLIAAFVFVYNVQTPVAPNTPSPWVARGIEAIPPPADPLVAQAPAEAASPPTEAPPGEPSGAIAAADMEPAAATGSGPAPEPEPAPTETAPSPEPAAAPVAAAPAVAEPAVAPPADDADPAAGRAAEPPPSLVRISRTRSASEHDRMLREAYSYYQAGEYESAAIHYLAVLNDRPDTLDALLGMGSIALRQNDVARAVDYFSRARRIDPGNQIAAAALIGLQRNPDPVASESALKFMLQESPDSAFLYFVLGNVYAAQSRWPEAQQAFFDAYRNDSANPDYALNLAASLDRLGQLQPALDYYGVALKLAEGQPAGFDPANVQARIQALSAGGGQAQ